MTLKSRLQKLTNKLKPEAIKVHYFGWKDCTWSQSEGLFRQTGESKRIIMKALNQFESYR